MSGVARGLRSGVNLSRPIDNFLVPRVLDRKRRQADATDDVRGGKTLPAGLRNRFHQLLESLDQADTSPTEEELGAFFTELRPEALGVAVARLPRLANPQVRSLLDSAIQRVGRAHAAPSTSPRLSS